MKELNFIKMNGAGNDFVIFDAREIEIKLDKQQITKICDRKNIGCDQLIIIELGGDDSDAVMKIYNSDGSISGACGNATRCVASLIDKKEVKIKTAAGILQCERNGDLISVNMGKPKFDWQEIPLSEDINPQKILLEGFEFSCLNIGNPHAVAFIKEPLSDEVFFNIGPKIENNPIFSQKINVEFAQIISDDLINVRVWERGAGETMACGSGACAVGILAIKNSLIKNNEVTTRFKGGDLLIEWDKGNSSVIMTGGYKKEFEGKVKI